MRRQRRLTLLAVGGALLLFAALGLRNSSHDGGSEQVAAVARPNIVVVMTDDQTVESLRVMPKLERLLQERGTTFERSFATYPYCCPSRATFLTGQYAHNHGVVDHYEDFDTSSTLPVWLRRAGYRTGHIGKYINGYGVADPFEVPRGWEEWHAPMNHTEYRMFDYDLNHNERIVEYGTSESDYQTDVFADITRRLVGKFADRRQPFFLSVAPVAPHRDESYPTPVPAPRHAGEFAGEELPAPPSLDEEDVSDKPGYVRRSEPLGSTRIERVEENYRERLESLLAVDDLIGTLFRTLKRAGELEKTVVIFTSDNGFFHGEHRFGGGKVHPYEPSVRVPLILRGPGIPEAVRRDALVGNIDLAPTILDLAGARAGIPSDGVSVIPLAHNPELGQERSVVLESDHYPAYMAIRTARYLYVEYTNGERELYDLEVDPHQLESRHDDPSLSSVQTDLAERLKTLRDCGGSSCRAPH